MGLPGQDEVEVTEYEVHEANLPWLDKKFDRMAKIARQVESKPPVYKVLREEFRERKEPSPVTGLLVSLDPKSFDKFFIITVEGEPPKLAGWSFVATLTWTKDGNLLNKVPGVVDDLPARYRTALPYCDYCELSRRRTDSFIVRNDKTGEYQQVGRNCLAKFLGYSDPGRVAQYAAWLTHLAAAIGEQEEKLFAGGGVRSSYRDLLPFLTMVVAVSEERGWVSQAKAKETGKNPSIGEVEFQLSRFASDPQNRHLKIRPTEEHKAKALAAIEFARSDKLTTDTDYKHNLKISLVSDMFHQKASGVVASLINFHDRDKEWEYRRQQQVEEAAKRREQFKQSKYVGDVGERITVAVRVVRRRVLDGQFGPSYMFRMLDADDDVLVWFASTDALEEGKWYNLTGTVRRHEIYNDIKQTLLTRCKAEEVEEVVVPAPQSRRAAKRRVAPKSGGRSSQWPKSRSSGMASLSGLR